MAPCGIQIQSLMAVAFWLIRLRSVDGGTPIPVGDNSGWSYVQTYPGSNEFTPAINYQDWASRQFLTVNDALVFGLEDQMNSVMKVSWEDAQKCNASEGIRPSELDHGTIGYNFSSPGQFGFIHPLANYCEHGMKFTLNVSSLDGPTSSTTSYMRDQDHNRKVGWIVGLVTGAVLLAVLAALFIMAFMTRRSYWHKLRKSSARQGVVLSYMSDSRSNSSHSKEVEAVDIEWPWGPQRFAYQELKWATDSFNSSRVVGEGGFGTVYKGFLRDLPQSPVAVKRLSQYARQGAREFMAEVNIISQLRHRNLVQLLGWCDENEELILVYEYMPNGDLDDLIFGPYHSGDGSEFIPLSWKYRLHAFTGVATALVYLHEEWEQRVVHRDVKTSNVMLDSQFNARLGDFGLARLSAHSQAPRTTLVAGTIGYLAPEFNLTGKATDKTDVYAFGVVVLEVSCARRPLTANCILVDWVWELHKEEKLLDAIDPKLALRNVTEQEEMKLALEVGLLCCHPDPVARPSMRDVLNILIGKTPLPKMPRSKPVAVFADDQ